MDNTDNIIDFLKNPVMSEYLSYNDSVIRHSVSSISAMCEMLESRTGKSGKGTVFNDEMVSCMTLVCFNLMRMAEMNNVLANIYSEDELCCTVTDTADFMKKFCENCNSVTNKKITVNFSCDENIRIKTDESVLTYIMLIFIRSKALNRIGKVKFRLTGKHDGQTAEILLKAESTDGNVNFSDADENDFIKNNFNEISRIFFRKFDSDINYGSDFIKITCPLHTGNVIVHLRNRNIIYGTGVFSKYNIMLGDIM